MTIEHTYDDRSNLLTTKTTTVEGSVTTTSNTYDEYDRLITSTDERGHTLSNNYDMRGNKVSTTDGQNRTTKYTYSPSNKLIKTEYPDGTTESKNYDAMDNLLSETNTEGETTSYEYDGADRLVKTTYADGTTTSTTYDEAGRTLTSTDQNGNTTTFEYDEVGNQISQTDALGNKTTQTYDAQGNRISVTDALGQTTTYEYNKLNQQIKTTHPDGTTEQSVNNASGMPTKKIDEKGNETSYGYDTSRDIPLLNTVTLPNNATTTYGYDSQNKKVAQIDAKGRTTSWSYTELGELSTETLPLGQTKTFNYDVYGKQTEIKDYASKAQKFIYDSNDKLVRIEYADGNTITYDYTPSGRLKSQTDAQGTIANTYDSMGRLKSQTNTNGETISYSYDGVGNIVQIQTPTQSISKTYTKRNQLESVTDSQGTITYGYDTIGRNTAIDYSNGMKTTYEYDSRNRITNIEHKDSNGNTLKSFAYTLDSIGNRTKIVEDGNKTIEYQYDKANRLTEEKVTNDSNGKNTITTFDYDDVGNLLTKTINGIGTSYEYNDNDQLTQKDSTILTYDDNGNLIKQDENSYEYDAKNRLTKVITPTDTVEYSYDANDNRVAKTTSNGTTTYLVDTNTPYAQVITESKEDGTKIGYTYGNDLLHNGTHFYLTDALGSTRGLVDSGEKLTDSYSYTPYGELSEHNGTSLNEFLYTGEQLDSETDNYYLRARYYSPQQARFTSIDPFEGRMYEPNTLNDYIYAGGNPILYTDPSGEVFDYSITSIGLSTSIISNLNSIKGSKNLQLAINLMKNTLVPDGKGGAKGFLLDYIEDLAINAVMDAMNRTHYSKTTAGTVAHTNLEKLIKENIPSKISWYPYDVYIFPEVFKSSKGDNVRKRKGGSLGVDIIIATAPKGKIIDSIDSPFLTERVILDLKTGAIWDDEHIKDLEKHFGKIPIVQIIVPIFGKHK